MESLLAVWRLSLLVGIFAFPQLLGILFYFRFSRAPRWLAAIAATLAPGLVFFWLAPLFLFAGLREAYARGEITCGMPAVAALFFLFAGTIFQVFLSVIVQVVLFKRRRRALFHKRYRCLESR
jgi:hypothetical protein